MSKKMVRREFDPANPPALTAKQKAQAAALRHRPEGKVDTSDVPPLSREFWRNAVRNPFYKPTKTATTVRVDSDVLLWLKSEGKGYQTRLNSILREAMIKEVTKR
ncbi:BrnA antitoxin family protein [Caenimonas aquaedulcis]|uniref:BrnA antitoxin family protein n=1 Tax=Caenimonas aquaedulcis TaxID=2793270 RepID=A0A931H7H9_9BURK|nr:BrnA antitoxin family protein [Caenimonas aquaedulcis]MBG9389842.1 BrnA antitoxin family protein [Caenimonas aquaedulcis]